MKLPSIGIIGHGFVGAAIADGFKHYTSVKVYDVDPMRNVNDYFETIEQDILFVCLPTPMAAEGRVDISIVRKALLTLHNALQVDHKPVILKSTIPPSDLELLAEEFFPTIHLVYSPEFLTERTSSLDFQQQNRLIFGDHIGAVEASSTTDIIEKWFDNEEKINNLFVSRFPMVPIYWTSLRQASIIKYFTNVFFATKISLINEFAQISEAFDLDPNDVIGMVLLDQRIGRSHWKVPGHDGHKGFGGSCFPKDLNGYLNIARDVNIVPMLGLAAWHKNLEVRPEKDWEQLKGRAVSEEKK